MSLGASGTVVQGNEISRNGGSGGVVSGPTTVGNTILSNSIYGNAGGGISLVQEANRRQVAHKLTSARLARRRIADRRHDRGSAGRRIPDQVLR